MIHSVIFPTNSIKGRNKSANKRRSEINGAKLVDRSVKKGGTLCKSKSEYE